MTQLAVRGSQGLFMMSGSPRFDAGEVGSGFIKDESANCRVMSYSPDGNRFAWSDGTAVHMASWDAPSSTWKKIATLEASAKTTFMRFSPKGTVLATWEVFAKGNNQLENNVRLWSTSGSGQMIHAFTHRKSEGWCPQWTSDEVVCCHKNPNGEVVFFQNNDFSAPLQSRLSIKALDSHYMSPKPDQNGQARVACYVPGQKGAPGFCKIFVYPKFNPETEAVAIKSFMNADRMEAKWSSADGKSCLILAQAEVDKSGASYYGKTQLCYANTDGDTSLVQLPKDGPIYSVEWAPTKPAQFAVVYGYMPARATLFNKKCESVFDFGTGPRNMVLFNPIGNLLLLGGFGNLRGNIEIWDVMGKKKAAQFEAPDATDVKWSPDSQHIMTATCAPRLRTGNGLKVWHYTSTLFHETVLVNRKSNATPNEKQIAAPTVDELWEVQWRPVPEGTYPPSFHVMTRAMAGGLESKTPTASKQAYRPPGARNRPVDASPANGVFKTSRTPVGVAPGAPPPGAGNANNADGSKSASAMKNKKRKDAAKKKKEEAAAAASSGSDAAVAASAGANKSSSISNDDRDKQVKKLDKKLQDIEKLKARKAKGETLEVNQMQKIEKEAELIAEMKKLKAT